MHGPVSGLVHTPMLLLLLVEREVHSTQRWNKWSSVEIEAISVKYQLCLLYNLRLLLMIFESSLISGCPTAINLIHCTSNERCFITQEKGDGAANFRRVGFACNRHCSRLVLEDILPS